MAPACIIMPVHRPDYRYAARSLRSMQQYGTDVRMTPVHLIFDIELDLAADGGRMPAVCASGDCVARDSFVRLRSLEGLMSARGEAASASRRLRAALADAGAASGTNLSFYNPKGGKPSWLGTNGSALKASGCMPLFHHYAGVVTWKRKYQALKKWYGAQDAIEAEGCATLWVLDSESYAFRPFSFEADVFGRYRARPALHVGAHRPRDCGATERLLERCAPALFSLSTGIARGWEQRVAVRVDGMVEGATERWGCRWSGPSRSPPPGSTMRSRGSSPSRSPSCEREHRQGTARCPVAGAECILLAVGRRDQEGAATGLRRRRLGGSPTPPLQITHPSEAREPEVSS